MKTLCIGGPMNGKMIDSNAAYYHVPVFPELGIFDMENLEQDRTIQQVTYDKVVLQIGNEQVRFYLNDINMGNAIDKLAKVYTGENVDFWIYYPIIGGPYDGQLTECILKGYYVISLQHRNFLFSCEISPLKGLQLLVQKYIREYT